MEICKEEGKVSGKCTHAIFSSTLNVRSGDGEYVRSEISVVENYG